jgi:hypothetical protein
MIQLRLDRCSLGNYAVMDDHKRVRGLLRSCKDRGKPAWSLSLTGIYWADNSPFVPTAPNQTALGGRTFDTMADACLAAGAALQLLGGQS